MSDLHGLRVLVTGGSGFLGAAVVRELVGAGAEVHLFARETSDLSRLSGLFEVLQRHIGDLRRYATVKKVVERASPDVLLHLASAGMTDPFLPVQTALRHNVSGTLNLLQAVNGAERADRKTRLIVARTPGERDAMNVYAASKAAAWQFARMYNRTQDLPILGVMPFQVYGPGQPGRQVIPQAIRAALAGEDFAMTHGTQVRDWIIVEDVARGFRRAAERGRFDGSTVELGTGVGTDLLAVVEMIYQLVARGGQPLPGRLPPRPGEAARQVADAAGTERAINWRAEVPLEEGLRRAINSRDTLSRHTERRSNQ